MDYLCRSRTGMVTRMNVLFFSMLNVLSLDDHNLYSDLIRIFIENGHHVTIINTIEQRNESAYKQNKKNASKQLDIIEANIGDITNTPFLKKGLSLIAFQNQIIASIKKRKDLYKIDLFLAAIPPITFDRITKYIKKRFNAKVFLLLKDIWPASIFDISVKNGYLIKLLGCSFLRHCEKLTYRGADKIGCISQGSLEYVKKNNEYIDDGKLCVVYNSFTPMTISHLTNIERQTVRVKYSIPKDRICLIFGGTMGVGQNISFVVDCIRECKELNCHFVICGSGIQFSIIEDFYKKEKPQNLTLINRLPKIEYEKVLDACDIGLLFIRYTAQTVNYPYRLLSYMEYSKPIFASTDPVTDLPQMINENQWGWTCYSNDPKLFKETLQKCLCSNIDEYGKRAREGLERYFSAQDSYNTIIKEYERLPQKDRG